MKGEVVKGGELTAIFILHDFTFHNFTTSPFTFCVSGENGVSLRHHLP